MTYEIRSIVTAIAVVTAGFFASSVHGAAIIYNLGTLGGTASGGYGINDSGQVSGDSKTTGDLAQHVFRYTGTPGVDGAMADLGTLGGTSSYGFGFNASGQVSGQSHLPGDTSWHAFRYTGTPGVDGVMADLGTLGGSYSSGRGMNASGQVAGYSVTTEGYTHAFRYTGTPGSGGVMDDLGTLGGTYSTGYAINASGQVTGESSTTDDADVHAFIYTGTPGVDGAMVDLGTLGGGMYSTGWAINANEQVAGTSYLMDGISQHAFLYIGTPGSGGAMADLGTLGGMDSAVRGMNAGGQIVGFSTTADSEQRAFLYTGTPGLDGQMINLDTWLDATDPTEGAKWTLYYASRVSDNGLITGYGLYDDGVGGMSDGTRAFILDASTLIPESSSPLPLATADVFYSATLAASGGTAPFTWVLSSGSLPAGLTCSSSGVISGTALSPTNVSFIAQRTDHAGLVLSKTFSLKIVTLADAVDQLSVDVTTSAPRTWFAQTNTTHDGRDAAQSGAITNSQTSEMQTTVTGPGTVSFWWKVSSESGFDSLLFYVDGITERASISGTTDWQKVTYTLTAGSHVMRWVYAKDSTLSSGSDGGWVDQLTVPLPPTIMTSSPLPSGTVDTVYEKALVASGNVPPFTWDISAGSLPIGLSLSSAGLISGTPSMATNASFTVRVTDFNGLFSTKDFGLTISAPASYTVTFDLGTQGTWSGGGDLIQQVVSGGDATAPTITTAAGWTFTGWDQSFSSIFYDLTVTALYFNPDSDNDGLPDEWETLYFASLTESDGSGDFDIDGISDGDEYICGTQPNNPDSVLRAEFSITANGFVVSWNSVEGRFYDVLWASSLTNSFQSLTTGLAYPQNSYTDTVHAAESVGFYRVTAAMAPVGMVSIPVGTNSGTDPDFGAYSLTVSNAFYMDATEVTKEQWDTVYTWALSHGYQFDNIGSSKAANHPVQTVSWYDCVKWCNARSEMVGKTPCYTVIGNLYKTGQSDPDCNINANGYRLPTRTEWEYAARGGLNGKRFPWGDTITHSDANFWSWELNSYDISPTRGHHPTYETGEMPYTSPVGSFAANGYGLFDMAGNIFEWCWDMADANRTILGGGWHWDSSVARCSSVSPSHPSFSGFELGFRTLCRKGTSPSI